MEKERLSLISTVSTSTARSYSGSYIRLRKLMSLTDRRKPIKNSKLQDVLEIIRTVENPSTAYSVFVIAKKIYSYADNKELFDKLDLEIKIRKRKLQVDKNENLDKSLPTFRQINDAVRTEPDPITYIVSFIMFKLTSRNQDISLIDLHASKKDNYNIERNHLIVNGANKVTYIRNLYKTSKRYGSKINTITVKKFQQKVLELLDGKDTRPLLVRKNGEYITPSSSASYLKKYTVLGLNESIITKTVLREANQNGDYNMLRRISLNRGTTVQVLLNEYDVSNTAPVKQEVDEE